MKTTPLILLLLLALAAAAQEKESFYVFDANWNPTKVDSAHYFLRVHQMNDSCWQWDYYAMRGPMLKSEQYRDEKGKTMNGVNRYYDDKGALDSSGMYKDGKKNGDFYKIRGDSLHIVMKYVYRDDVLVETIDPAMNKNEQKKVDSVERESEFPGGVGKWLRYLSKNLKYPDRAVNANIQGDVRVAFIVGKEGEVVDPYISRSVEYSLDEESLRIIRGSGKWNPAFQYGKIVRSYKIQPINFRLR